MILQETAWELQVSYVLPVLHLPTSSVTGNRTDTKDQRHKLIQDFCTFIDRDSVKVPFSAIRKIDDPAPMSALCRPKVPRRPKEADNESHAWSRRNPLCEIATMSAFFAGFPHKALDWILFGVMI